MNKTVKVRIAVAVCSKGHWSASRVPAEARDDLVSHECMARCNGLQTHYVTATVPLAESVEVEGEVTS